ncbi:hypothetical protein K439DRAFT_1637773 [Ramaria rubella]|nr:hypothetical protein K439DRAFT_1637773 [Ramaria rubella]
MPSSSGVRQCLSFLHACTSRASATYCSPTFHRQIRGYSEVSSLHGHEPQHSNPIRHSSTASANADAADAIAQLYKIFPPLNFPPDVAQRMTTHVSWERGVKGHNGKLGFVGRRVLHTYLLLFLHECALAPSSHKPAKNAPIPPSSRLRPSSLFAGGLVEPLSESYDDISDKLLNTYILGEHVGAAWQLERIMRWTPAIAEVDALQAQSPDTVLRSSGLYKVRGATVEGVVGGIFHQFGGTVAHRVFHTRILPHIYQFGLPPSLHVKMKEACERMGGERGHVDDPQVVRRPPRQKEMRSDSERERRDSDSEMIRPRNSARDDSEYVKVGQGQRAKEMQRLGFVA